MADTPYVPYDFRTSLARTQGKMMDESTVGADQEYLAEMLRLRAEGRGGPSVAEQQLQRTTQQNLAGLGGALGAQRGLSPALAARTLAGQGAAMQQEAAGQGAVMRAQEQLAAQNALAGVLQARRQQDILQQNTYGDMFANAGVQVGAQDARAAQAEEAQKVRDNAWKQALVEGTVGSLGVLGSTAATIASGGLIPPGAGTANAGALKTYNTNPGMARGGVVPGVPVVEGDHPVNDQVPTYLSPGEGVIPRSIMESGDPNLISAFAQGLMAQRKYTNKKG